MLKEVRTLLEIDSFQVVELVNETTHRLYYSWFLDLRKEGWTNRLTLKVPACNIDRHGHFSAFLTIKVISLHLWLTLHPLKQLGWNGCNERKALVMKKLAEETNSFRSSVENRFVTESFGNVSRLVHDIPHSFIRWTKRFTVYPKGHSHWY